VDDEQKRRRGMRNFNTQQTKEREIDMADSYCMFGIVLNAPANAMDWMEKKLDGEFNKGNEDWDYPPCLFERDETDATEMVIKSEADNYWGDSIDSIVEAICEMQDKFSLIDPISFTWSEHWPEERVWTSHGGAAVCHKGKATRISARKWEMETLEKLL
jgi:hypothetical protein